jgi:hypothetical protein
MFSGIVFRQGILTEGDRTVDLLIKTGCFVKEKNILSVGKAADLNSLVQGGQRYWYCMHFIFFITYESAK